MSGLAENATLLAKGTTADVYAWGEGRVLELFTERTPWHAIEVSATRAAQEAGLPVPALIDGLIEVGQREGIVFERVDGSIMTEHLQDHPDQVEDYARQAAELQAGQSELAAIPWQTMRAPGSYRGCGWMAWKWKPLNRCGSCGGGSGGYTCSDMASCDPLARKLYCPGRLSWQQPA